MKLKSMKLTPSKFLYTVAMRYLQTQGKLRRGDLTRLFWGDVPLSHPKNLFFSKTWRGMMNNELGQLVNDGVASVHIERRSRAPTGSGNVTYWRLIGRVTKDAASPELLKKSLRAFVIAERDSLRWPCRPWRPR